MTTISRGEAAIYLDADFSTLASIIGQSENDDCSIGYGPDIDNALRLLGETESNLSSAAIDESNRAKYHAALSFYAARRFWTQLVFSIDTRLGPYSESGMTSAVKNLEMLMNTHRKTLESLGLSPEGEGVSSVLWNTDWVEPEDITA